MLAITEAAAIIIAEQHKETNAGEMFLRLAAKANQDGSIEYGIGFDDANDHDIKINQFDIVVITDPQSAELLDEATMDYVEIENGQFHFIFSNPLDKNYTPPKKG